METAMNYLPFAIKVSGKFNMADEITVVARWAISSRFLLLFFQNFVDEFIIDYDSSSIINKNRDLSPPSSRCDLIFQRIFGGFGKWDAAYFLKIAKDDYKYEQFMAFFPLFPWILRILVRVLHPLFQYFLNERSLYLAIGWMLNSTLFTLAAISLNKLTFNLFGSRTAAKLSSLLFCFNPASVFMSSLYTESLFSCLQFTAMYFLEQQRTTLVVLLFSLGCATRSNGVLSCGFLAHRMTKNYVSSGLSSFISDTGSLTFWHLQSGTKLLLKLVILNGIVLFPFIIFQLYGYYLYCIPPRSFLGNLTNSPWCDKLVPFSYSYIQDNYWNVGFLCYFEFKQIPNFALASPVIILSVNAVLNYCLNHRNIETVKNLGLFQRKEKSDKMTRKPIRQNVGITGKQEFDFYQHPDVFVYVVHLFFMTLFGFTSMHVQVTTRFVASASPVIYWYSAHVIMKETYCQSHRLDNRKWKSQLIIGYFLSYFFIGTALHCNFYPWT